MIFRHMGIQRLLIPTGGFIEFLYVDHPNFNTVQINGIIAKALHYIDDGTDEHTGLPQYSSTSDMYFRIGKDGTVVQGKVYVNRRQSIDFDWSHKHVNSDGTVFNKGIVHVQTYQVDSKGKIQRMSDEARYMTEDEIAKYGEIIHAFNPNVRFRP